MLAELISSVFIAHQRFNRLDRAATSAPSDLGPVIRDTQDSVMDAAPPGESEFRYDYVIVSCDSM